MTQQTYGVLKFLLTLCAVAYIGEYVAVAVLRMGYPFDLEWMEGGMADHVRRVITGLPLYVRPSIDFTPFIYPPLYYLVSACMIKVAMVMKFGDGVNLLPVMRMVSFACSLGTMAITYLLVRLETGHKYCGLLAAALFAAAFGVSGAWYDLARLDSLFTFLLALSFYLARRWPTRVGFVLSGIVLGTAFHAKQSAIFPAAGMAAYLLWQYRKVPWPFLAAAGIVAAVPAAILNAQSGGWYAYYVFALPGQHPLSKSMVLAFWGSDIAQPFAVAALVAASLLFLIRADQGSFRYYLLMLGSLLICSFLSRVHTGGYNNVLMPGYLALCVAFGVGYDALQRKIETLAPPMQIDLRVALLGACLIQFCALFYNPVLQVPTKSTLESGRSLLSRIAAMPGEVYLPSHGQLAHFAGKDAYAHAEALDDILRGRDSAVKTQLITDLNVVLRRRRFAAVLCDDGPIELLELLTHDYVKTLLGDGATTAFPAITGIVVEPNYLYLPRVPGG